MKTHRLAQCVLAVVVCGASGAGLCAQEPNCDQTAAMARMTRAKSSEAVIAEKQKAGDSYRAQVVFAARSLELRPTDKAAAVLVLNLIPQNDGQQTTWMTLGDSLCDSESVADMKSLGRVGDHLPRDLTKAVRSSRTGCRTMSPTHRLPFKTPTATTQCRWRPSAVPGIQSS
jgi:hypothetical protein